MVTMLWVQLQAEGRMQSNTDKSCNSLHRSSEYWENQVFLDAGHIDYLAIGAKKYMHYIANNEDTSD